MYIYITFLKNYVCAVSSFVGLSRTIISHSTYLYLLKVTLCKKFPHSELFWSAFFPHFTAFRPNTVSLRIQSECGIMRQRHGPDISNSF